MLVVYKAAIHIVFGRKTEFVRNNDIEIIFNIFCISIRLEAKVRNTWIYTYGSASWGI